jgi:hypothetical protein
MALDSPLDVRLIQMAEGTVSLECNLPSGATHIRIYLSSVKGYLGALVATQLPGQVINAQKGRLIYATVRAYNSFTGDESTNTDQHILQMFERVCFGYNIFHFFHEPDTHVTWAIGYRNKDGAVCLLKSSDYFDTYSLVYSWASGSINNGGYLSFYIDKNGFMYVANRPSALISKDSGSTWQQLPWKFQVENAGMLTPFWNISEDEENNTIVFSEYGSAPNGPHHSTFWSSDPARQQWTVTPFDWGEYRHIHGYHINPYLNHIHFLFLGDPYQGQPSDGTPGFYVSQDGGATWSDEVLNQPPDGSFHDGAFYNAPCHVTWWKGGKAFITNDTAGHAAWWGNGTQDWGVYGLHPNINLINDVESRCQWPVTPWTAMAVRDGYETYCVANHLGGASPSVLWRYDGNAEDEGDTGKITVIALAYHPAPPFLYMSGSRGNVFPKHARYVFNNGWGGIRIPRVSYRRHHRWIGLRRVLSQAIKKMRNIIFYRSRRA